MTNKNTCHATALAVLGLRILFSGQSLAQEGKRVAYLDGPLADKFTGAMTRGFMEPAKAAGLNVTLVQSPFDPALQAQQLDDAVAQKVDLIVLMTMSPTAIVPALTRAKAAHIPVLLLNVPVEQKDLYTAFVGEDSLAMGEAAGKAMGDALTAAGRLPAKVAVVSGNMDEGLAPVRIQGFKKALEDFPGITVVAIEETHWTPAQAERAAGQLLARFSDLDGIYGMNDAMANGVVQAAEAAGIKLGSSKGSLVVVGGNCMAPGIADIGEGSMQATTSMLPARTGQLAAETATAILTGKPFAAYQTQTVAIVTKGNLNQYRAGCTY